MNSDEQTAQADPQPDFGPRGYLPERAAKRARKIVLRGEMSVGWPLAAIALGLLVVVGGIGYLLWVAGPPREPFVPLGPLDAVDPRGAQIVAVEDVPTEFLVVRAGGGVRVFEAPAAPVGYCPESRRLESAAPAVWDLDGRLTGGEGESLRPMPVEVHTGELYADPTGVLPPPAPTGAAETPTCAPPQ